jgi:integrase
LELSEIAAGPLFRKVNRGGVVETARPSADVVRQILLKRTAKAGVKGTLAEPASPHGLRAGFGTTAYGNGVPDEEIMGHARHHSLTTMRSYVRRAKLSQSSPADKLGLKVMVQPTSKRSPAAWYFSSCKIWPVPRRDAS